MIIYILIIILLIYYLFINNIINLNLEVMYSVKQSNLSNLILKIMLKDNFVAHFFKRSPPIQSCRITYQSHDK